MYLSMLFYYHLALREKTTFSAATHHFIDKKEGKNLETKVMHCIPNHWDFLKRLLMDRLLSLQCCSPSKWREVY